VAVRALPSHAGQTYRWRRGAAAAHETARGDGRRPTPWTRPYSTFAKDSRTPSRTRRTAVRRRLIVFTGF